MNTPSTASVSSSASASFDPDRLLRVVLRLDSAVTGANGLAYAAAAVPLAGLLGGSIPLLVGLGAFLVVVAGVLFVASRGRPISARVVGALIAINVAWVIASLTVAAVAEWPTPVGRVWAVVQAVVVLGFVVGQALGLRRAAAVSAARA